MRQGVTLASLAAQSGLERLVISSSSARLTMEWKIKPLSSVLAGAGEMAERLREDTPLARDSQHPNGQLTAA